MKRLPVKKLMGKRLAMSFAHYKVGELWRSFMPKQKEIASRLTNDLVSVTVYKPTRFTDFNPTAEFEKRAAVEVSGFEGVAGDLETFVVPGGICAVFDYKGLSTDHSIYQYIFRTWLPASNYDLDDRPHFEIFGDNYRNNDPASEEEIWIPIKPKSR